MSVSCRAAYKEALTELARADERIACLDSDTGLWKPDDVVDLGERYVPMGIAEANLMGVAAGLAITGRRPFVTTMATFATTRAAEQVKVDIAIPGLPVRIAGTHAGLSAGHLGPTHHALEDLSVMRALPGMTVVVPADADSAAAATRAVDRLPGPAYLRLDRAECPPCADRPPFRLGTARVLREGADVAIVACGPYPVSMAVTAGDELAVAGIRALVLDCHTLSPLDVESCVRAGRTGAVVTVEEHAPSGGLGDAVAEVVSAAVPCLIRRIAVRPPVGLTVGGHEHLLDAAGVHVPAIIAAAHELVRRRAL